jgi:hypothetical protein
MLHLAARRRVCLHFDYTGSGCEEGGGRKCAGSVLIAFMYVHSHSHTPSPCEYMHQHRKVPWMGHMFIRNALLHDVIVCGETRAAARFIIRAKSVLQISFSEIVIIFISALRFKLFPHRLCRLHFAITESLPRHCMGAKNRRNQMPF